MKSLAEVGLACETRMESGFAKGATSGTVFSEPATSLLLQTLELAQFKFLLLLSVQN